MSKKKRNLRIIEEEKNSVVAGYIAGIAKTYKIKPETLRDDIFKDITRLIDDFLKKGGLY